MNNNNNNNIDCFIDYWVILCALIALIMSIQSDSAYAWCDSNKYEINILSHTDGLSFHNFYYKINGESVWNEDDINTFNKEE